MFYEWIGNEYRQPRTTGERTICRCCGGELIAVVPHDNHPHWRHRAGDCDPWSEPEGAWHLGWKERFPLISREIPMIDEATQERHRADVFHNGTIVELQHSPISEKERDLRDAFYTVRGRMFWLVHLHDEKSFNATSFALSWDLSSPINFKGREFYKMRWYGRSKQFIEKWKRSRAHVFFARNDLVFYLATFAACADLMKTLKSGEFAISIFTPDDFVQMVGGSTA